MIRDVSTRWNSTAELVQRALELAPALRILSVMAEYNKVGRGVRLARFQLSPEEWKIFSDLSPLLDVSYYLNIVHRFNEHNQVFLFATNQISTNKIPLIHQVIPIFDIITTALEDNIENDALPLIVRHAALRGYYMLNKYYSLTDDAVVYRIAMSKSSA